MLPRSGRLSGRQLELVMEKGRAVHSPFFLLRAVLGAEGSAEASSARIAAVVPVKIAKRAVDRTRLRRRIYAAVSPISSHIRPSHVVILAKSALLKASQADIDPAIRDLFVKAGLLK